MLDFDIWTVIFSVINILVLFFFLKKFLFGRVNAMLEKRASMVQADLDEAKQRTEEAEALKKNYEETLSNAKDEARQIIADAQQTVYTQSNEITTAAQQEAAQMLSKVQKQIALERQEFLSDVQGEIADLALAAASKLLEEQLDDEKNRALVNAFLSEGGDPS
ncbi:MAG: F0F1 ATP synthase subunit B [Ruminococcus sp.]|nr:F0F1 ATP synthase subunit B [Ruminococcus sp.]